MPLLDLAEADQETSRRAEICVIGAGMAGLLLARRLAAGGVDVVVVESGGSAFDELTHALNAMEPGAGRYARAMTNHYRGLGGTSSRWGGRSIPISAFETGPRPHLSLPAWPFDTGELADYQGEIEELFGLEPGPFDEEALEQLDKHDLFPRHDPDFTCRWAKWPNFRRCNLATILAEEVTQPRSPEIWLNATVTGFGFDREAGRLASIEARNFAGKHLSVAAEQFVFAAGTIETTRLLHWLNACSDGHAFGRTQVLGRYFQDHLSLEIGDIDRRDPVLTNRRFGYHFGGTTRRSMHLELTPEAQIADGVASAFAYVTMELGNSALARVKAVARGLQQRRVEIAIAAGLARDVGLLARTVYWRLAFGQLYVPPDVAFRLSICIEQLPDRANRLDLGSMRDALGVPMARLDWRPRPADERTFRAAVARIRSYWTRSGFEAECPVAWAPFCDDSTAQLIDHAEDYAHPSGTTRMGTDPVESVVDPNLRCHDIPNVSVASASTFPAAGSANPSLTIMALALRLADRLLAERTSRVTTVATPGKAAASRFPVDSLPGGLSVG